MVIWYSSLLIANSVKQLGRQASQNQSPVTEVDIARIRKIVKRDDFFDLAARSIAPSIFGHEYVNHISMLHCISVLIMVVVAVAVIVM